MNQTCVGFVGIASWVGFFYLFVSNCLKKNSAESHTYWAVFEDSLHFPPRPSHRGCLLLPEDLVAAR